MPLSPKSPSRWHSWIRRPCCNWSTSRKCMLWVRKCGYCCSGSAPVSINFSTNQLLEKTHENITCHGCRYRVVADLGPRIGAERKHDEWRRLGRRLDGWIWRDVGADRAGRGGGRPGG